MPTSPRSPSFGYNQPAQAPPDPQGQNIVMELPGDMYHPAPSTNALQPDNRLSGIFEKTGSSPNASSGRWSHASTDYQSSVSSRPTSYASDGIRSPGLDQKGFAAELPTMQETREEQQYRYNPQDFVNAQAGQQYAQQTQYAQSPVYMPYHPQR
jgi:hypothetical protein